MTDSLQQRWAPTLGRTLMPTAVPAQREDAAAPGDEQFSSPNAGWEDAANAAADQAGVQHTGVMIALFPSREEARELAVEGGEPVDELHCTLAFLGEAGAEVAADARAKLDDVVTHWAATQGPIVAKTNGVGVFDNDPPVTYATVDSPQLPAFRQSLVEALEAAGFPPVTTYGFVPHMTLAYDELPGHKVPRLGMTFGNVVVAFAGNRTSIPLTGSTQASSAGVNPAVTAQQAISWGQTPGLGTFSGTGNQYYFTTGSSGFGQMYATDRPTAMETQPPPVEPVAAKQDEDVQRAFTTEINGKTLIAAPARTLASMRDPSLEEITAEPLLWMHGKFVGAEVANRNGALWSSGDLEMGQGSVAHGPLNWLHEARHIIGSIAKADFVKGKLAAVAADSADAAPAQPHITATAAIWKWIYPDEAFVVNQASDLGQLWYSMECISKEVGCAGPNGCGNTTTYAQYMNGAACDHVTQRASIRHFKNPVFLGGAVIVPPTRPGWAEADASVMKTASGLAEAAYEQAGEPDMSTSNWEQLMAQLVLFANQ
jgi:2'-5' RNA ligase